MYCMRICTVKSSTTHSSCRLNQLLNIVGHLLDFVSDVHSKCTGTRNWFWNLLSCIHLDWFECSVSR